MCIIDGRINNVAKTRIFVAPSVDGKRQLTVYSNSVDTREEATMILPVPNPASITLETVHKELFNECKDSFDFTFCEEQGRGSSRSHGTKAVLAIHEHGSYQVVIVPSLDSLDRVPTGFIPLSDDIQKYLKLHYDGRFGVLLCKLRTGVTDYEPFAYSHDILDAGAFFLPTRHYHTVTPPHGLNLIPSLDPCPLLLDDTVDDWDHEIYSVYTEPHTNYIVGRYVITPKSLNMISWEKLPANFRADTKAPLRYVRIFGKKKNQDMIIPFNLPSALSTIVEATPASSSSSSSSSQIPMTHCGSGCCIM